MFGAVRATWEAFGVQTLCEDLFEMVAVSAGIDRKDVSVRTHTDTKTVQQHGKCDVERALHDVFMNDWQMFSVLSVLTRGEANQLVRR